MLGGGSTPLCFLLARICLSISSRSHLFSVASWSGSVVAFPALGAAVGLGGCTKGEAWTRSPRSAVQLVKVLEDFLADSRAIAHVDSSGSHVSGKGTAADLSRKKESH